MNSYWCYLLSVFFVNYPLARFAGTLVAQTVLLPQGAQVLKLHFNFYSIDYCFSFFEYTEIL